MSTNRDKFEAKVREYFKKQLKKYRHDLFTLYIIVFIFIMRVYELPT